MAPPRPQDATLMAEEERAFRVTVRARLTEVLRALVADLDLSTFALLQVRTRHLAHGAMCKRPFGALFRIARTFRRSIGRFLSGRLVRRRPRRRVFLRRASKTHIVAGHFWVFFSTRANRHASAVPSRCVNVGRRARARR